MGYGQTASSEQMTFLGEEHTTQGNAPAFRYTKSCW